MTANQMHAYRVCVNAYVDLLLGRGAAGLIIAHGRMLTAFGYPPFSQIPREVNWRFACSFRRVAERIARAQGWTGESWFALEDGA